MKLIPLKKMEPLMYLVRHWGKWYYIDLNGNLNRVKDVVVKLKQLEKDK